MTVAVRHKLVRFLGSGIETNWMIGMIFRAERSRVVEAIDRGTRRVHKMGNLRVPTGLENIQESDDIRIDILAGMIDAVPNPRLRGEMDDTVEGIFLEERLDRGLVFKLHPDETHVWVRGAVYGLSPEFRFPIDPQLRETRELKLRVIITVDSVDPDDGIPAFQKPLRRMKTYKSGRAGQQYSHSVAPETG